MNVEFDSKTKSIYDDIVVDDKEAVEEISKVAAQQIYEKFRINYVVEPRYLTVEFFIIWDTLIKLITEKEKTNSEFLVNVYDRFEVGFKDRTTEDDEKMGNFVPSIKHLGTASKNEFSSDAVTASQRCVQFNSQGIVNSPDFIKHVAAKAHKRIEDEANIKLSSDETIIPLLVTTYDCIIDYCKIKLAEICADPSSDEFTYEINFASCFDVIVRQTEDPSKPKIAIKPSIYHKLMTKSDGSHSDLE